MMPWSRIMERMLRQMGNLRYDPPSLEVSLADLGAVRMACDIQDIFPLSGCPSRSEGYTACMADALARAGLSFTLKPEAPCLMTSLRYADAIPNIRLYCVYTRLAFTPGGRESPSPLWRAHRVCGVSTNASLWIDMGHAFRGQLEQFVNDCQAAKRIYANVR